MAATLLRDFFEDSSLDSLDQDFAFTTEGVEHFHRYYLSELPHQKYASKLKGKINHGNLCVCDYSQKKIKFYLFGLHHHLPNPENGIFRAVLSKMVKIFKLG